MRKCEKEIIDFVPTSRADELKDSVIFTSKSLGAPVSACWAWTFEHNDRRRRGSWYGTHERKNIVTALDCKARIFGSVGAGAWCTNLPVLAPEAEIKEEETLEQPEEEVEETTVEKCQDGVTSNSEIRVDTTVVNGWKCSYTKLVKPSSADYLQKVAKLEKRIAPVVSHLCEATTRVPYELRKERQDRTAARKKTMRDGSKIT